ncbi:hypothetical protein BCV70DRAFT_178527 [Testicularia cyperi]|uniref:CHCH domain-containing protein n=1 Tax=Testicularia cyperi TaxID=1882483 RepID=A0A317XLS4_9BASI|nr:hypothetical protein BCV70DRAFT_178527 [Testicularia cyperi]
MPRSSRSSGGRSAPSGSRGAHTMAAPPQHHQQPAAAHPQQPMMAQQQQRSPGLFGQMASTAAGVAVGSTVGHGLSNMLFGGSSSAPAEQAAPQQPQAYDNQAYSQQNNVAASCEQQSRDFIKCLESTNDMNSCSYYLEQLKACQAAARPY